MRVRSVARKAAEYFSCALSVLEWARRQAASGTDGGAGHGGAAVVPGPPAAGTAQQYLEASVMIQEAHLSHLSAIKMANLYKISWVRLREDLFRPCQAGL